MVIYSSGCLKDSHCVWYQSLLDPTTPLYTTTEVLSLVILHITTEVLSLVILHIYTTEVLYLVILHITTEVLSLVCLLYTSDAADE